MLPISDRPKYLEWATPFSKDHLVFFLNFSGRSFSKELNQIIDANKVGILHIHFGSINRLLPTIRKYSKTAKVYYHLHSNPLNTKLLFLKKIRNRLLLPKNITFIACSDFVHRLATRLYSSRNILTVNNAIDFERLNAEEHCIPSTGAIKILMFGYDVPIKGVDTAISAIKLLPPNRFQLDVVVASNMDKVKRTLKEMFGDLPANVRLICPEADVKKLYGYHDLFLVASRTEGLCYSALESYYSGLKVICSDIPACKDLSLSNLSFFQVANVEDLAASLLDISKQVGPIKNDVRCFSEEYSLLQWASRICGLFTEGE